MQRYGLGMVVWCTLLGMALAAEQRPAASGAPHVFVQHCSACHGVQGRGDGPAALPSGRLQPISRGLRNGMMDVSPSTRLPL
jgi:mono/diheme cytochrome c family protein